MQGGSGNINAMIKGLIGITQMKHGAYPICNDYLQECRELGYTLNDDFNDAEFEGADIYEANMRNGKRDSISFAYLHPALKRGNLTLECHAQTEKILFDQDKHAIGASVRQHGVRKIFNANIRLPVQSLRPSWCNYRVWQTPLC